MKPVDGCLMVYKAFRTEGSGVYEAVGYSDTSNGYVFDRLNVFHEGNWSDYERTGKAWCGDVGNYVHVSFQGSAAIVSASRERARDNMFCPAKVYKEYSVLCLPE
jgi:hypothetical protein